MGKNAPQLNDNIFYNARKTASENRPGFESREKASEFVLIEKTRLAKIESGKVIPHPEEVCMMAKVYGAPELCNAYCSEYCPVGSGRVEKHDIRDIDRITLRLLGSIRDTESIRDELIGIMQDGQVTCDEYDRMKEVLGELDQIVGNTQSLKLWIEKNVGLE